MIRLAIKCSDGEHADDELRFDVDDVDIVSKVTHFLTAHLQRHGPHDISVEEEEGYTWQARS